MLRMWYYFNETEYAYLLIVQSLRPFTFPSVCYLTRIINESSVSKENYRDN